MRGNKKEASFAVQMIVKKKNSRTKKEFQREGRGEKKEENAMQCKTQKLAPYRNRKNSHQMKKKRSQTSTSSSIH
jgi:hypothetical protein